MSLNRNQKSFVTAAEAIFGDKAILNRDDIQRVVEENNISFPYWFVTKSEYRAERGQYQLPDIGTKPKIKEPELEVALAAQVLEFKQPKLVDDSDVSIPAKYPIMFHLDFTKTLLILLSLVVFILSLLLASLETVRLLWSNRSVRPSNVSVFVSISQLKPMNLIYLVVLLLSMVTWSIVMDQLLLQ
jgi:hypothetical protein